MESIRHDLIVGARLLWKDRAFAVTAALTLALCIGANTALFSVVYNVLLRPLPVPASGRIVVMENLYPGAGAGNTGSASVPDYFDRLRDITVYESQALYRSNNVNIDQNGTPTRVRVTTATPSFFRVLQMTPALGRPFGEQEGEVGHEKNVILSYSLWQTRFGGDPGAVGRDLRLDGEPYTIVGVMPKGFAFINPNVMLWRPAAFTAEQKSDERRHGNSFQHIARLKPGATVAQAQAQIDALNAANLGRFPQYRQLLVNAGFHTLVTRLQDNLVKDVRSTLYLLWGGALFVLLIGCVNVANLVLVRSRARLKEFATRLALGAGRARLARQLVTESILLTLLSAAFGLLVGYGALQGLGALNIQDLPRGFEIRLDPVVVAFTIGMAVGVGVLLGVIPVMAILPVSLTTALREEGRGGTSGRGVRTLRRGLVMAQVAFAFVLLVGAGLLLASFRRVIAVDPGFNAEGVLTASISLPRGRYQDDDALRHFTDEALVRIRRIPGVSRAGATDSIPFGGSYNDSVILAEGYQMQPGESVISPSEADVSTGYFEAMGVTLLGGRWFDERDNAKAPPVLIIDERLANRFWPGQDAVGRRLYKPNDINNIVKITEKTVFLTVVGVVKDVKLRSMVDGSSSVGTYYYPMAQDTARSMSFALKTTGDPTALMPSLRQAIREIDPELPVFDIQTMEGRTETSLVSRRSPVLLSLVFGAVSLFLSAIGIYGVLAYLVTQRRKEIGIRLALGSSAAGVFELILREGVLLIAGGFALGAAGAALLRRALESQLFGIGATDPVVLGTVAAVLAAVALAACVIPARRATRIDPVVALAE